MSDDLQSRHPVVLQGAFDVSPPVGWEPLVDRMLVGIERADPAMRVRQIKTKFGELRVYLGATPNDEVSALVDAAVEEASRTCEACGAPGRRRNRSWIATLCDDHAKTGVS